ncbi:MAG: amino acid carrier protein [Bythopirellula sp.]|nr:amino acid carrier protein [Bythopirellula sp.]
MENFAELIQSAADAMFMPWTVGILMATGIFFTIRLGFVQVRRLPEAARTMLSSQQSGTAGALPPWQAFMMALAATIGTGNIAGVATAIVSGGPGALFWIWCYGFFAMAIKFAEAVLGLEFRIARGNQTLAGPMYYLRDGIKSPTLAWTFAFVAGMACLFTTPLTQPNSVAVAVASQLERHELRMGSWTIGGMDINANRLMIGFVLAVLTWLVIIGGVKAIGRAAEWLSPLKVGLYMIGGIVVIGMHAAQLPEILAMVFREAFSLEAGIGVAGGVSVWTALRYGLARGAYANEAGYGTAAVVYGVAKSARPEQQGLNAVMEVFIITFVTSSISALSILLTGVWNKGETSSAVVAEAFNVAMPSVGGWMLAISVFLFGYTTLIGWAFYGEQFLEYLFGPRIIAPYRWCYCLLIPFGAVAKVDTVWAWGDILNALQIFPNLVGLFLLSGVAAAAAKRIHVESKE